MNAFLEVIKTPITSLVSGLIIYIFYMRAKKQLSVGEREKSKASIYIMLFLLSVILLPFWLYFAELLSTYWLYAYLHELVIAMMIVLPLVVLYLFWIKTFQPFLLSSQLERLSLIEQLDIKGETWMALEQNIISDEEAEKAKILRSLRKWIVQGNEIGWYEIKEQVANKPIDTQARWFASKELSLVQQQRIEKNSQIGNYNYEKRLEALVMPESVGEVWQKWDIGLVSDETAHEVLEMNAFEKWVWKNDETGWVALQNIRENKGTLSPRVIKFAEFELWEIDKRKKRMKNLIL